MYISGHGSGGLVIKIIEETNSNPLIPIHSEHEEHHKKWYPQVKEVQLNSFVTIG